MTKLFSSRSALPAAFALLAGAFAPALTASGQLDAPLVIPGEDPANQGLPTAAALLQTLVAHPDLDPRIQTMHQARVDCVAQGVSFATIQQDTPGKTTAMNAYLAAGIAFQHAKNAVLGQMETTWTEEGHDPSDILNLLVEVQPYINQVMIQ